MKVRHELPYVKMFAREAFLPNSFTPEAIIALVVYTVFAITVVAQCFGLGTVPAELMRIVDLITGALFGRASVKAQNKVGYKRQQDMARLTLDLP